MRIIHCITRSEHGGSQAIVFELMKGSTEHETMLVTGEDGWLSARAYELGAKVVVVPELVRDIDVRRDIRALVVLRRLFARYDPDIIHLHTSKAGFVGRLAARNGRARVVYTPHGWAFSARSSKRVRFVYQSLERIAEPLCDRLIAVSEAERRLAVEAGVAVPEKIEVIYNGVPDSDETARPGEDVPYPTVIMVARFARPKRVDFVLRALAPVTLPFRLVLVGGGEQRATLEALASAVGMSSRTQFLGERSDVSSLLSQSHILVHASDFEALCLSVVEAMRAGLPVVACASGGIAEAIENGATGYLVDSEKAFRSCVCELLGSPSRRAVMGRTGRERYLRLFQNSAMVRRTLALYRGECADSQPQQIASFAHP